MKQNDGQELYSTRDLRKDATYKTSFDNRAAYDTMIQSKINTESNIAKAGMLACAGMPVIRGEDQIIPAWDLKRYSFLLNPMLPYTVNPKLWVQGNLNLNAGLFMVTDNIYQIRGFDLANMTFIKGNTGWIVLDCLSTKETAEAAIQFVNNYFGHIPILAVIITHSHEDHYGGISAMIDHFADDNVLIYVPVHFKDHVIEENVTAGIAMSRRGIYQFGVELPRDPKGQIDDGIGKTQSIGTVTFSQNVQEISDSYVVKEIDGITFEFLLALDTEAPSEMFVYLPDELSLCIAEDCNATLHNLLTLRGAKVRDAAAWAESIQNAIDMWGKNLTTVFGVHNWPRFGKQACIDYLEKQRDVYQYINDQTLRLINQGYTLEEVGRMVQLPNSLAEEWYNSEFYGTVIHNAKAVYQRYLGWYDGNPVNLNKLLPVEAAKKYVEYMGGEDRVLENARKSYEDGEYQWVAEVMKQVIFANPDNKAAKLLCADALEQLGYIAESGIWRNEYLMGAQELRFGVLPISEAFISYDVLDNIPLGNILYLLSIRIDGMKAGDLDYKINFIITKRNEYASTELKRGIFRYLSGKLSEYAAVTVTMPKEVLYEMVTSNEKPDRNGVIVDGDVDKWNTFLSLLDRIDPNFNIMTPIR